MMRWLAWVLLLGSGLAQAEPPDADLVAWCRGDSQPLATDLARRGATITATGAAVVAGRTGQALRFAPTGGLSVALPQPFTATGFALDLWVRFDQTAGLYHVASQDGAFLLRVDPPNEGGALSFFVDLDGQLEPRLHGPRPVAGRWQHVVASWDGRTALLWVDGQSFSAARAGGLKASKAPVLIAGPSHWAPAGLPGAVEEVKLYRRGLGEAELLAAAYGLDGQAGPTAALPGDVSAGWLRDGLGGALVRRGLRVPTGANPYATVRMAVSGGQTGKLVFRAEGLAAVNFPLRADGQLHSYVLRLDDRPEWDGTLTGLALLPSDSDNAARVETIAIGPAPAGPADLGIDRFLPATIVQRAGQPVQVVATVTNHGGESRGLSARLEVPAGVTVISPATQPVAVAPGATTELRWTVRAAAAAAATLACAITGAGSTPAKAVLPLQFTAPIAPQRLDYVPLPQPVTGDIAVGCHYCPLWKQGARSSGWEQIAPYPDRQPALGWYDEDNPEVSDWEFKWALDHGISFFVYCWYRANQGRPVQQHLDHAIHQGLFHSRYGKQFKFSIMWENQSRGTAGTASEDDFLNTLLPYWIETYFKHPSYQTIDGKPLLYIYRPELLVKDLGSVEQVKAVLAKARERCRQAGLKGLTILGEYRGADPRPLQLMVDEGLDYSFAYCWGLPNNPAPAEAIKQQEAYWQRWKELNRLPFLLTLSMGWDSTPWHPTFSAWRLPPTDFETLCRRAKAFMSTLPAESLGRKVVLLDNWNEFGEGHYIAPHRQYGFGYLDAVRRGFFDALAPHVDLVPADIGRGPYDQGYQRFAQQLAACRRAITPATPLPADLVAWWNFDEDGPVAFDATGHQQGGLLAAADRAPGKVGRALVCQGGSVTVPAGLFQTPTRAITIEAWLRTDVAQQNDKWFVNSMFGDGRSGFRFGLAGGKLSWAVPQTAWSHHLTATTPLPLGAWVHVAATYDGHVMRVYQNGREVGHLDRSGPLQAPANGHLCLGSFDTQHVAHFTGLLDEVKVWRRALTPAEIAEHARQ